MSQFLILLLFHVFMQVLVGQGPFKSEPSCSFNEISSWGKVEFVRNPGQSRPKYKLRCRKKKNPKAGQFLGEHAVFHSNSL